MSAIKKLGSLNEILSEFAGKNTAFLILSEVFPTLTKSIATFTEASVAAGGGLSGMAAGATALLNALNPVVAVAVALAGTIAVVNKITKAVEEYKQGLIDTATESTSAWSETTSNISDLSNQYKSLKEQLDSGNLSNEEEVSIKQEILDLQTQITSECGNSAAGIDLINGGLDTQLAKLKEITEEQAKQNLEDPEKRKAYEDAEQEMGRTRNYKLSDFSNNGTSIDGFNAILSEFSNISLKSDINGQFLQFTGSAEEADETLAQFISRLRELKENTDDTNAQNEFQSIIDTATEAFTANNEVLENYQENYNAFLEQQMYSTGNGDLLTDYTTAVKDYNDALASGDSDQIKEAKNAFNDATEAKEKFLSADGNEQFSRLFGDIEDQLDKSTIKINDFSDAINGNSDSDNQFKSMSICIRDTAEELKNLGLDAVDVKDALLTDGLQDGEQQILSLANIWGITAESSETDIQGIL